MVSHGRAVTLPDDDARGALPGLIRCGVYEPVDLGGQATPH